MCSNDTKGAKVQDARVAGSGVAGTVGWKGPPADLIYQWRSQCPLPAPLTRAITHSREPIVLFVLF